MTGSPVIWLVAGPDGVGKTTYAMRHIRAVTRSVAFVNLDEIARGLSPLDPEAQRARAARVALDLVPDLIASRATSFTIETTLAGRTYLPILRSAAAAGWGINLLYFVVDDVETALARIARRVTEGGHDVPEADVRRRFARSIGNLPAYAGLAAVWRLFDNNGPRPRVVAEGRTGCVALRGDLSGVPAGLAALVDAMPPCAEA